MTEVPGSEIALPADLVLLSLGFVNPVQKGIIDSLGLKINNRKNILTDLQFQTSQPKIFAGGDARDGASLVVNAIHSGRKVAEAMHSFLIKT